MNDQGEKHPGKLCLVVQQGGIGATSFELLEGSNLIGRWDPERAAFPEIDLENDDPEAKISRKHAVVVRRGDRATIQDLGSLNGTFLNRQKLEPNTEPLELHADDEIIIGKTVLKVKLS
jgi:pSer/pThr/pTyr-binding forkhead associated (FHA) protein